MSQINLFASDLTPIMQEFLSTYRDGELTPIGACRLLDEHPHPHIELMMAKVERGHILMEVSSPLIWADINWLFRRIMVDEEEYTRGEITRYCIRRCLNPRAGESSTGILRSEPTLEEWDLVKIFRRALEAPSLALRHLKATYLGEGGFIEYHKFPQIFAVEYDHIPNPPKRHRATRV